MVELFDLKNPHDKFVKKFLSNLEAARDFIKKCFTKEIIDQLDLSTLEMMNGSYIDGDLKESESDLVYKVIRKKDNRKVCVYVLIEHKSYIDEEVSFQILKYMVRIWAAELAEQKGKKDKKLSVILPIVMYHGEKEWTVDVRFRKFFDLKDEDEMEMFIPNFEPIVFDLCKKTEDEIKGEATLQVMLLTLRCILSEDFEEKFKEILESLERLPDQNSKIEYLRVVIIYLIAAIKKEEKENLIETVKKNLIGGEEKLMETIAESWFNEGKEEGIEEGIEKGIEKGKELFLLDLIKTRFGKIPRNIRALVKKMKTSQLKTLGDKLFTAKDLNELFS